MRGPLASGSPRAAILTRGMGLRRVSATAVALFVTIATVAGCGGSSHKQTRTSGGSTRPATTTTKSTTAAVKGLATADDYAEPAINIDRLRVTIYDLRRSGPFVILDFGAVCVQPANDTCATGLAFTPSEHERGVNASAGSVIPDRSAGVYLVDPTASKEYRPVADRLGRADTSLLPHEQPVGSTPVLAWAKFPAPPASVTSLDVVFPNGGPQISSIPISSGAAHTPTSVAAAQPAPGAYPADSTTTTGLTLPVVNLQATVGNPNGNDVESPGRSTITLRSDVLFHFDKSNLTSAAQAILAGVADRIKARAVGTVTVTGYTDSIGTDAVNIPLSQARAASVVAALRPQVAGAKVTFQATGQGSADPVAPNTNPDGSDNPAGRARNRRVTISFAAKTLAPPAPPAPASPQQTAPATSRTATFTVPSLSGNQTSTYQVTVGQLVRDGAVAVLHLTVTCQATTPPTRSGCDSGSDLGGTPTIPPIPPYQNINQGGNSLRTASGFYLIDPASGTQYIPFYDADGVPLASPVPGSLPVGSGGYPVGSSYPVWVYYPAPPANVTSVTVALLEHRMQVAGVPLTNGG